LTAQRKVSRLLTVRANLAGEIRAALAAAPCSLRALARAAGARRLQVFHFSPRYEGRYGEIVAEAQAEFAGQEVHYGELDRRGAAVP